MGAAVDAGKKAIGDVGRATGATTVINETLSPDRWGQDVGGALGTSGKNVGINSWLPEVFNPARWSRDIGGAKNAGSNMDTAKAEQKQQASDLNTQLLQQPKTITPDNFLATKAAQLAQLRLGMASTMTGAGGAPGATLGSTALTGSGPGKTKMGQ